MSLPDFLLSVLLGLAAAAAAGLAFHDRALWVRAVVASGCGVALIILLSVLGIAFNSDTTSVQPGRGVTTIAPPGPSGGVR